MSDRDAAIELAARALHQAARNQFRAAGRTVAQLIEVFGDEGMQLALMAWCDYIAQHDPAGPHDPGKPLALAFQEFSTGEVRAAGAVEPETAWAGQMIVARLQMDEDQWRALLAVPPRREFGRYAGVLLYAVSLHARRWAGG